MAWNIGTFNTGHKVRTYTPTVSNTSGVDASTPGLVNYIKVGDVVFFWGTIDLDLTSGASFNLDLSLPTGLTSNFAAATDAGGLAYLAVGGFTYIPPGIVANPSTDKLLMIGRGASNANQTYHFSGTFKLL